ncbi:MAG: hypothetical protein ACYTGZ_05655 [Planctomycetota bacterium]|jgi:hypothetical protein
MRILTILSGPESVPLALQLTEEIRSFNAEIDFRLRFLHVEIEEVAVAAPEVADALPDLEARPNLHRLDGADRPTLASARLALIVARERPMVLVIVGNGPLWEAAEAAAVAADVKMAQFGGAEDAPASAEGEIIDLGSDPAAALDTLTGVAREIG